MITPERVEMGWLDASTGSKFSGPGSQNGMSSSVFSLARFSVPQEYFVKDTGNDLVGSRPLSHMLENL